MPISSCQLAPLTTRTSPIFSASASQVRRSSYPRWKPGAFDGAASETAAPVVPIGLLMASLISRLFRSHGTRSHARWCRYWSYLSSPTIHGHPGPRQHISGAAPAA